MKTLLSSLILVVALFIPHYLQAQEINGVYSATIAKTSRRGGLVARLSGSKQKVRLFLYESNHMLFARYEVYENAAKDRTPSGQIYLAGSYSKESGSIRLEDAGREIHDLNIGYPIREFAGRFDKSGKTVEPKDCFHCQGEKLTKELNSDKEWRAFQHQIEEIKMKILYPGRKTTRQHRGVFFRLKNGKEWLSLGATDKVKLYVDNAFVGNGDTLKAIAEVNDQMIKVSEIQYEANNIMRLKGTPVIQALYPEAQVIQIYKYPSTEYTIYHPQLHVLNAIRSEGRRGYGFFTVQFTDLGKEMDATDPGYPVYYFDNEPFLGPDKIKAIEDQEKMNAVLTTTRNSEILVHWEEGYYKTTNPSGRQLEIRGLNYRELIRHIYYGRFDAIKTDVLKTQFSALHNYFLIGYYLKYKSALPANRVKVGFRLTEKTLDGYGRTKRENEEDYFYYVEPRFEDKFYEYLKRYEGRGLLTQYVSSDVQKILSAYQPGDPVLKQLYENIFRFSVGLPPIDKL